MDMTTVESLLRTTLGDFDKAAQHLIQKRLNSENGIASATRLLARLLAETARTDIDDRLKVASIRGEIITWYTGAPTRDELVAAWRHFIPGVGEGDVDLLNQWVISDNAMRLAITQNVTWPRIVDAVLIELDMPDSISEGDCADYCDDAWAMDAMTVEPRKFYRDHVKGLREWFESRRD